MLTLKQLETAIVIDDLTLLNRCQKKVTLSKHSDKVDACFYQSGPMQHVVVRCRIHQKDASSWGWKIARLKAKEIFYFQVTRKC